MPSYGESCCKRSTTRSGTHYDVFVRVKTDGTGGLTLKVPTWPMFPSTLIWFSQQYSGRSMTYKPETATARRANNNGILEMNIFL